MKFPRVHLAIICIAFLVSQSFFGQTVLENAEWYIKKPTISKKISKQNVGLSAFKVVANKENRIEKKRLLAIKKKKKLGKAKKVNLLTLDELESRVNSQRLRYRKVTNRCFKTVEPEECGTK